jgi:hypothetical protein
LSFDKMDDEKMALFVRDLASSWWRRATILEGRSLHPRTRKSQEGASSVEARMIFLLNAIQ